MAALLATGVQGCLYGASLRKSAWHYAWSSPIEGSTKRRFSAVLHIDRINSPLEAVRAAIVAEYKREV
jgi:hypothetical protein